MLTLAETQGASYSAADTDASNTASQRVLIKCGLTETHCRGSAIYYERELTAR